MDHENKNLEKNSPVPHALAKFAAFALLATLSANTMRGTYEQLMSDSVRTNSVAALDIPMAEDLAALEQAYPEKSGSNYVSRIYDTEASNGSTVVYRHEGLEGMSFARPTLEVSRQILEATTVHEMEASASPFFKDLGINLYMTQPHPGIKNDVVELEQEDLEAARTTLLSTLGEIAITPREVITLANVKDVVFARGILAGKADGVAYWSNGQPGTIAINVGEGNTMGHANTWNHELGHQVSRVLNEMTKGAFNKEMAKLNPAGYIYKDQILLGDAVDQAIQKMKNKQALETGAIISDYSGASVLEDEAESYTSLWRGDMAPDRLDPSYGKLLGAKRVLWIESMDQAAPGFKQYLTGLSSAKYGWEPVPYNLDVYERYLKAYPR